MGFIKQPYSAVGDRRGFAIVLVAMLAGLVLALGIALVAVIQLQSAASQYDQHMSIARDNARAAMDIAIAELQRHAGRDRVATFTADVLREATEEDFNEPSNPDQIFQPFWTGVHDSSSGSAGQIVWLVTKPLGSATAANPQVAIDDAVIMVGPGSVQVGTGDDNAHLYVKVPRERIVVSDLSGYESNSTVGHYAYWVGDMGVKASYALYDPVVTGNRKDQFDYEPYTDAAARDRLWQMRLSAPEFPSGYGYVPEDHADLIDSFLNDFQIRGWGHHQDATHFSDLPDKVYLSESEVRRSFHDFAGRSVGLLVNSKDGVFKKDASSLGLLLDSNGNWHDEGLFRWANVPHVAPFVDEDESPPVAFGEAVDDWVVGYRIRREDSFESGDPHPTLSPVITEFNLNYALHIEETEVNEETSEYRLYISLNAGFELWNPYTCALLAEPLEIRVSGLPKLNVHLVDPEGEGEGEEMSMSVDLMSPTPEMEPRFLVPGIVGGDAYWTPGKIAVFALSLSDVAVEDDDENEEEEEGSPAGPVMSSPFVLTYNPAISVSSDRIEAQMDTVLAPSGRFLSVEFSEGDLPVDVELELWRTEEVGDTEGNPLLTFTIDDSFSYEEPEETNYQAAIPSIGFAWRIRDEAMSSPMSDYDPRNGDLAVGVYEFNSDSGQGINVQPGFQDASVDLLGRSGEGTNLPVIEIPRQEVTTVAQFGTRYRIGDDPGAFGDPDGDSSSWFDELFFSTAANAEVPPTGSGTLGNSFYRIRDGANASLLKGEDAASELFVDGMFNIHSTSIQSWTAILKSNKASEWPRGKETEDPNLYLFFNRPHSADSNDDSFDPSGDVSDTDRLRHSLRQGVIALNEEQIDVLSKEIVTKIRERVQAVSVDGNWSAFTSLADFIDSGVLQSAIEEVDNEENTPSDPINPSWVVPGSARHFTQRTILNLIAPYISVRSDTFVIRAYGDAVNPADATDVWARAYCESIVQRVHDQHSEYGRQFKVIAIRWLNPSDI